MEFFRILLEVVTNRPVKIIDSEQGTVDVQIESVYQGVFVPSKQVRLHRLLESKKPGGIRFDKRKYSPNQQPRGKARFSIFFTGENQRPPEGTWNAYLTFDSHSFGGRNSYLPLWWINCTDLLFPKKSPFLGREITIQEMTNSRVPNYNARNKFCVAFIGKAYPMRMHALSALSSIGKVDVYGALSRDLKFKKAPSKFEIAQNYRFVFAFENDLYPGYVTEKAPEAWATGAIPLYWGLDPSGHINQKSLINLNNFKNLEQFIERVKIVNESKLLWEKYASQPFLIKKPNLNPVIRSLRLNLFPLVRNF